MHRRCLLLVPALLTASATIIFADEAEPSQAKSPKTALMAQDAAARAGNVEEDRDYYRAEGEQQTKLAQTMAKGDVALARLEAAVNQRFGKELADEVVRAAGAETDAALEKADEKIDGDHARIAFADHAEIPMSRDNGKWRVSLSEWTKGFSAAQMDQLIASMEKYVDQITQVDALVEHDKFRSGQGVRDRIADLHDRLFGHSQLGTPPS